MNRRRFIQRSGRIGLAAAATGIAGTSALGLVSGCGTDSGVQPFGAANSGAGIRLDIAALENACRRMLFDEYLPFWEKGGYDEQHGGFMCYLNDDGSVQDDRKDIWYQGRGIWVYSYLYNQLDRNQKWLDMATRSRDFMVSHMYRAGESGEGGPYWLDTVSRTGEPVAGLDASRDGNIYGALFAAVGLIQLAAATGSDADLSMAKATIEAAVARYEDRSYAGVVVPETEARGLRAQGHSFMLVWILPQLLVLDPDPALEGLLREHVDHIEQRYWHPDFGISNETLFHDYSRIPGLADFMVPGHSIETQWMAAEAAAFLGEPERAGVFRDRMRRLIEMSWDYVYGGIGDTGYRVFGDQSGPVLDLKTMWAQTEVLVGTLRAYTETDAWWAADWYNRSWDYVMDTMLTGTGVWRQAVDRTGAHKDRPGIPVSRKGNFHQPRCLLMNLLDLERIRARAPGKTDSSRRRA